MDFVLALSHILRKHDLYLVLMDRFFSIAYFIMCNTTAHASHVVHLFLREVVRLHHLLRSIVSERDVRFTFHFWRTLRRTMGTALQFFTSYHPEIDEQELRWSTVV